MKKNEQSLRELWDTTGHTSMCAMEVTEGKEGEEQKNVDYIVAENVPNNTKNITYPRSLINPQRLKEVLHSDTSWSNAESSRYISEELKTGARTHICIPMFTAALFTKTKRWKQCNCPSMNEWINRM